MVTDAPDTIYRVERSWRHGIVFADVLTTPGLPPLSRLVYACLTTYANAAGEAWPSAQRVASDLGIGRSTVLEAYSHLENAGVIRRIRRTAPSGRSLVTVIRLLDRGSPADQGRVQEVDPAQGRVQEVDPREGPGGGPMTQTAARGRVQEVDGRVQEVDPRDGPGGGPKQEQLTTTSAREEILNLRAPQLARCKLCGIPHLGHDEPCSEAGRRHALTQARGIGAVRAAQRGAPSP